MKLLVEKFAFDTSTNPPLYCGQTFSESGRELVHEIGGAVRATVPALAVGDYLEAANVSQALTDDEKRKILETFSDFV
ncbi:MAG: hypothetical protein EBR27_09275 [Betaproteobacteria bacterium]|nr:hypothetical protein [Betaproteobacteria bacterium]